MKKFKYPLCIKGTPEQLREIREELLKLGHEEYKHPNTISDCTTFTLTHFMGFGMDHFSSGGGQGAYKVSASDKDLVLALAAMVDDDEGHKGEAYMCIERGLYSFTQGKLYFLLKDGIESICAFTDDKGEANGHSGGNHKFFRKATKEEIINHFSKNKDMALTNSYIPEVGHVNVNKYAVDADFIKEAHTAACKGWKEKIEEKFPELFKTYRVGQRLVRNGEEYIIARINADEVVLINLVNGNRFRQPIEVGDDKAITPEEFDRMGGKNNGAPFTQIK